MPRRLHRVGAALMAVAAFSMTAAPVMARGWGGGWGHHYRHRDRVDAGDVIAGLLIFGTVAAVASAASNADKNRRAESTPRYRSRDYRDDARYDDARDRRNGDANYRGASGIGNAVEACAGEVERSDRQIDTVDSVERDAEGWRVEGRVGNGSTFACSVSDSGRIRSVTVDGRAA